MLHPYWVNFSCRDPLPGLKSSGDERYKTYVQSRSFSCSKGNILKSAGGQVTFVCIDQKSVTFCHERDRNTLRTARKGLIYRRLTLYDNNCGLEYDKPELKLTLGNITYKVLRM